MRRRTFLSGMAGGALVSSLPVPLSSWAAPAGLGTIAFTRRDGLWVQALPDGKPVRILAGTEISQPRFSSSGRWISYFEGGVTYLRERVAGVVSRDGKQDKKLGMAGTQWWPGRDELLVETSVGTTVHSAAAGWSGVPKTVRAHLPVLFSPDGKQIAYSDAVASGSGSGGEQMRTGLLRRAAVETLARPPVTLVSKYLSGQILCAWSRNGEYIVYWEDPDFSASVIADGLELFRVPAAGGSPISLGVGTLLDADLFALSPVQNQLAVTAGGGREEWEGKRIAVIDLDTAAVSYLTDQNTVAVCPSWSPDGRQLAYSAAPAEQPTGETQDAVQRAIQHLLAKRRIWAADVPGTGSPRQLTRDDRYRDEAPLWSADGQSILFCRIDDHDQKTLWMMEADGSRPAQIAEIDTNPGPLGASGSWFGYYGHIGWRNMFDWFRG